MKFILGKDKEDVAQIAERIFVDAIRENPKIHLCLATGSTPVDLYKKLIESYKRGEISFKEVETFNLDNYLGLDKDDINNYEFFMKEKLFNHIDIPDENWRIPSSEKEGAEETCREYEEEIERLGIDLCLLGIGENGHIAFNEPSDFIDPYTHIADLKEDTIRANSRFFPRVEDVPTRAITMGMGSILKAKKIVLLATGEKKREAMERLYKNQIVDSNFPVSFLYLHPDVTIVTDSIGLK